MLMSSMYYWKVRSRTDETFVNVKSETHVKRENKLFNGNTYLYTSCESILTTDTLNRNNTISVHCKVQKVSPRIEFAL